MRAFALALLLTAPGCTSSGLETSGTPAAPAAVRTWCSAVPITDDPTGDLTGKANTFSRVDAVATSLGSPIFSCPGVGSIGMTVDAVARAKQDGVEPDWEAIRRYPEDEKTWVILVMIDPKARQPIRSPLYSSGVRVYFMQVDLWPKGDGSN